MDISGTIYCPVCHNIGQEVTFKDRDLLHCHLEDNHRYLKCVQCPVVVYVSPDSVEQHNARFHTDLHGLAVLSNHPKRVSSDKNHLEDTKHTKLEFDKDLINPDDLTEGEYCVPSRYSKDPLRGFFLQSILLCSECIPTKRFTTHTAWNLHQKTFHKNLKTIGDYKKVHGDPDLVKFKHKCRECQLELVLNLNVVKRHLLQQHHMNVSQYKDRWREELLVEKRLRPCVSPSHTMDGWWEGCMYKCQLCLDLPEVFTGQVAFENHLSTVHTVTGQKDIDTKYISLFGKLTTLSRFHQCFMCQKIVRHEYRSIFQHLTKHGLDIETYAVRFKNLLAKELEQKGMGYVIDKAKEAEKTVSLESYLSDQRLRNLESSEDPMDCWYDGSEHKCNLCGLIFWSNLRFHWHVKRVHGISGTKDYRRLHGDPEQTLRQHKCQVCGSLIKWEASRIRDHLKFHKKAEDKLTLKQYGEKFRNYIMKEVIKYKKLGVDKEESSQISPEETEDRDKSFSVDEWKALLSKKVSPQDRVECNVCNKVMNRHSYTRHREKAHQGILNTRDLNRLKRKQIALAKVGVSKSLNELLKLSGGIAVLKGKGNMKEEVEMDQEDIESKLNLHKAGLTVQQIERKVELMNSGLTITKANVKSDNIGISDTAEIESKDCGNEHESEENYPTYVVDQETGEILVVEEVAEFSQVVISESVTFKSDVDDSNTVEQLSKSKSQNIMYVGNKSDSNDSVGCGSNDIVNKDKNVPNFLIENADDDTSESGEYVEDGDDGEDGPLGGQIMQIILPDERDVLRLEDVGGIRIIRLKHDEVEEEYVVEDGKLMTVINPPDSPVESSDECEELESFVMLGEDGTSRIVIEGQGERIVVGEQQVLGMGQEKDKRVLEMGKVVEEQQMFRMGQVVREQRVLILGQVEREQQVLGMGQVEREQQVLGIGQVERVETVQESMNVVYSRGDTENLQQIKNMVTEETKGYLGIQSAGSESNDNLDNMEITARRWQELGGEDGEYHRKLISRQVYDIGKVSQGTVVCNWTKMPGDRQRVAHNKLIRPSGHDPDPGEEPVIVNISLPLIYSSDGLILRDIGCQVAPHQVSGMLSDPEEVEIQKTRISSFLSSGGVLDRSCPGCGKLMSRQRNLVTHLQVIHGVRVSGPEAEEHDSRYMKENVKVDCDLCGKTISRKSIRRHINHCHPNTQSKFIKNEIKR